MACHNYCWWSYGCITEPGPAVHMGGEELCCQHLLECAMTRPWEACGDTGSELGAQTELTTGRDLHSLAGSYRDLWHATSFAAATEAAQW